MKIVFLLSILFLLCVSPLTAVKKGILPEVMNAEMMRVDGNQLYVLDRATIYVYSLDKLSLIRKFGKEGEGPGELKVLDFLPNCFWVKGDFICAADFTKIIYFSKEGKYLKEIRKPPRALEVVPVKNNFVVKTSPFLTEDKGFFLAIKLYDAKMKEIKELYRQDFPVQSQKGPGRIPVISDSVNIRIYNDKIFIEKSPEGFILDVFDWQGKKQYRIQQDMEKVVFSDDQKKWAMARLKEDFLRKKVNLVVPSPIMNRGWEGSKKWATFIYPDTLPPIQSFKIVDDRIYVSTFKRRGKLEELLVMDLKGKLQSTVYVPSIRKSGFAAQMVGLAVDLFDVSNNRLLYIKENEAEEECELHVENLE
ncbi:MAG: hypothetical protein GY765_43465 [bacterium]|nr:hypothetical protein [bacterium]